MATISKKWSFDSCHILPGHKGKCGHLHGHTYTVEVALEGAIKPVVIDSEAILWPLTPDVTGTQRPSTESDAGMVVDYADLNDIVKPLVVAVDHQFLNDVMPEIPRTTAELIACWFYGKVYSQLAKMSRPVQISYVAVSETPNTRSVITHSDWVAAGRPCDLIEGSL